MRVAKGLTQEQIADSMGCDASTVSRIESGNDRQLKWTDITGYANALKVQMSILFDDETLPASSRIKQCVFQIHEDLNKLAELANQVGGDDAITHGIDRFYKQVLFNFLSRFVENTDKLRAVIKIPAKPQHSNLPKQTPEDQQPERISTATKVTQ